jgi:hypothetical protein
LVLVSPTKRTIETAIILKNNLDFIITPLVGPRMFPQNPELPFLPCDHIFSKMEITSLYGHTEILDFNLDCWEEGINRIAQDVFEGYAKQLLDWIGERYNKIVFRIGCGNRITFPAASCRLVRGYDRDTCKNGSHAGYYFHQRPIQVTTSNIYENSAKSVTR